MLQKEHELISYATRTGSIAFVLVLGILSFGGHAASLPRPGGAPPAAPKKDHVFTQVYQYTYDEVFQAIQEHLARTGTSITAKDKDKGTIQATVSKHEFFDIHVETLNTKPETKVTLIVWYDTRTWGDLYTPWAVAFFKQVQQVLSPPPPKPSEVASSGEQPVAGTPDGKPSEPAPNTEVQVLDAASSKALADASTGVVFHVNAFGQTLQPLPEEKGTMKGVPTAINNAYVGNASAVFLKIPGQHSPLRVRAGRPAFIIKGDRARVGKFYRFGVFRHDRETTVSQDINFAKGIANPGLGFTLAKFGPSAFKFVPETSLPAGEYGIQSRGAVDIFTFGVEHFGSDIDVTSDPKFLAVDHIAVLPALDFREDQTVPVNLADLTNITVDLLKQDNYAASLAGDKGTAGEITEANLAEAKAEWIKRLGPGEARWVIVVGVHKAHVTDSSLEHTSSAEFVGFLFDKQDGSVLWQGKGTGNIVRLLLGGFLKKGSMPGEAERAGLTDLLSGVPTLPRK